MKVTFRINYHTYWGQNVLILGSTPELGEWDRSKALPMNYSSDGNWELSVKIEPTNLPILYTYIINENGRPDLREYGYPHTIENVLKDITCNDHWQAEDTHKLFRDKPAFWRAAGMAIPIFSLRSEKSFGIGEFNDLKLLTDWAVQTGQEIIQILPVNDTTMTHTQFDSYPYNAISIYALHPLYLNLEKMGRLEDETKMAQYDQIRNRLNEQDILQYKEVDKYKWEYFNALYIQEGQDTIQSNECQWFMEENKEWLLPYALFCFLRDKYNTADFRNWGEYSDFHSEKVQNLYHLNEETTFAVNLYIYLQFHLHNQLLETHLYANENNVLLKGDIPIGISRNSVEAWVEPELFHMDFQTGAPPDAFSETGQNWGFPTYNWEKMAQNGYSWWKKRFQNMSIYFDAYRIDHILGFFRIWEIPDNSVQGLLGHFNPALPLSISEIEQFGISFDKERFTEPYITDELLQTAFGEYSDEIKVIFLEKKPDETTYRFKKEYDNQRKITEQTEWIHNHKEDFIREKLFDLVNEVLFIEDSEQKDKYHPRIACYQSYSYRILDQPTQQRLMQLHNQYFYVRNNEYWKKQALKKLPPLLSSTDMLACGEDLGMIPDGVSEVMEMLQILSLEIQRMPKNPGQEFGDTRIYPYRSVCSTSTHDMTTLRGWWKENREVSQRYYNRVLGKYGEAPEELTEDLCAQIVEMHLQSPSMLSILPIQDWLSIDENVRRKDIDAERINVPADPNNNWSYRIHLSLEELKKKKGINEKIRKLIVNSKRNNRV